MTCRHCRRRWATHAWELCRFCYSDRNVRRPYAGGREYAEEPQTPKPARMPGEPPWPCLWCYKWACKRPLQKCDECEREYQRMAVGMPQEDALDFFDDVA